MFHAIPSNLPERFYADCKNWSAVFLQRSPKLFNTLKDLTEEQETALSQFKYAAQDWYKTNDLSNLYEVFKTGCDFLAIMPLDKNNEESKSLLVIHPKIKMVRVIRWEAKAQKLLMELKKVLN